MGINDVLISQILQGKFKAMVFCWVLGLGSLVAWNSMLTIGDYYYKVFPVINSWLFPISHNFSEANTLISLFCVLYLVNSLFFLAVSC